MTKSHNATLYKDVAKTTVCIVLAIFLCRITRGYFALLMGFAGLIWALGKSTGKSISCFALFPLLIVIDPGILPKTVVMAYTLRLVPLVIGVVLFLKSFGRSGTNRLPFGYLFLYLGSACISSIGGWHAGISYLKLLNFVLFLLGIWCGTQNLQDRPKDIYDLRVFFLSIIIVVSVGSIMTLLSSDIAYSTNLAYHSNLSKAEAVMFIKELKSEGGLTLFSGLLNHSQALAPILSCCISLTLADMLFAEKKAMVLHIGLLLLMACELFMTRSRTGLFSCCVGAFMMLIFSPSRLYVPLSLKRNIRKIASLIVVTATVAVVVGEASTGMFSRWVFKSNDSTYMKSTDFKDALTGTRQGLIDLSLYEFKKNPIFGMGFQVNYETNELYGDRGLVFSAPVEKGLLITTVLGEGGIVGMFFFLVFVICFYGICIRKMCIVTVSMFTVLLATNVGEATFFSPGGSGGTIWIVCVVGGFVIDTLLLHQRKMAHSRC